MNLHTLVFTDVVDSTAWAARLGDERAAAMWAEHDHGARALLAAHGGLEIDRSDGFFLLFGAMPAAADFARGYHRLLGELGGTARVGIHHGAVTLRHNPAGEVARGAKPIEVDGLAKPLAARIMSLARGGQTLISRSAREALIELPPGTQLRNHGHYRAKGLPEPLELFEFGAADAAFLPPADTEKVYRVLRDGEFWRPLREVRHNLVPERDAFIGREGELQALADWLDGGVRLLSVTGVGGTGKTRLVRRYAQTWLGEWPGGVYFCDLSEARGLDGILFAVGMALGAPLARGDAAAQLGHVIAARGRCLVILDNFEQVVAHAALTIGAWFDQAAEAAFVVTSRERLQLPGETVFALEPLAVHGEAIDLFEVRARAQRSDFRIDATNRQQVAEIVRLLDGLPLAVELAAARVRVLSTRQIRQRLAQRFQLLAGARGTAARQATLKAVIDWSWHLLGPWEQSALAQCAVFEGGFTMEAAEDTLDLSAHADAPPVMDAVQSLVDKSLLRAGMPGAPGRVDIAEPYFSMYLSIHEYAAQRLAEAGAATCTACERRHGDHFAKHGSDDSIEALSSHGGGARRQALMLELDNLVAACRRALERGDAALAVPAYRAAWEVLVMRGPFTAGMALGQSVLALPGLDDAMWCDAASSCVDAQMRQGRLAEALQLAQAMRERAERLCDVRREGIALSQIANVLREQGRMTEARPIGEAALARSRQAGNRHNVASVLHSLGNLHDQIGEPEASRASHEAALALHTEVGNRHGQASVLSSLAILNRHQGRLEESLRNYEAAIAILREVGDRRSEAISIGNMANTLEDLGRIDESLCRHEEALEIGRSVGSRVFEAVTRGNLGLLYAQRGRRAEAREQFMLGLAIDRQGGNFGHEGVLLASLGSLEADEGRLDSALVHLQAAMVLHRRASNRRYIGITSVTLGAVLTRQGSLAAALAALAEGEAELRAIDDPFELGQLLCLKSRVRTAIGDDRGAREVLAEAQDVARRIGAGLESRLGVEIEALLAQLA